MDNNNNKKKKIIIIRRDIINKERNTEELEIGENEDEQYEEVEVKWDEGKWNNMCAYPYKTTVDGLLMSPVKTLYHHNIVI